MTTSPADLIFITGSTGFIGSQVTVLALEAGYRVRLSVRKEQQIQKLKQLFHQFVSNIDFVVVPDITSPGAFDSVLDGVRYVFHLASPMPGKGADFRSEYAEPAVRGTETMLSSADRANSVEKVVIMSSVLALMPLGALGAKEGIFNESPKTDLSIDLDMEFPAGPEGSGAMYQASKILAHQATHAFNKTHKPHYTLVTLHPSFVLGRSLVRHSAEEIDGINAFLWQSFQLETPFFPPAWVHVKDVAEAHLKILELDIASGEEFVLSGHPFTWDDVATFVREKYPEVNTKLQGPFDPSITVDSSKAQKTLGFKWRTMEDMLVDLGVVVLAKKADENSGHDVVRPEKRFDWSTDFEIFQRFAAGDDPVRIPLRSSINSFTPIRMASTGSIDATTTLKAYESTAASAEEIRVYLSRDPEYRRLDELQQKGWSNPAGNHFFAERRYKSDNASKAVQRSLLGMMINIGRDLQGKIGAFDLPSNGDRPVILDLCMAPGGLVTFALEVNKSAKVDAFSLPSVKGGHNVMINYGPQDERVKVKFLDITMFAEEFGSPVDSKHHLDWTSLRQKWPYHTPHYDLVICDGVPMRGQNLDDNAISL
ncbi:unnamed protein product [Aureobasidium pullulans]|nr:unnamed protein product [Aureobasidium pullulans]